jgi:NAD/NADP transhydrogenase beta subunit
MFRELKKFLFQKESMAKIISASKIYCFFKENFRMVYGDAKKSLDTILQNIS